MESTDIPALNEAERRLIDISDEDALFVQILHGIPVKVYGKVVGVQLVNPATFEETPHYARPANFRFHKCLVPKDIPRTLCGALGFILDLRGSRVELELPTIAQVGVLSRRARISPMDYATTPAVSAMKLVIRVPLRLLQRTSQGRRRYRALDMEEEEEELQLRRRPAPTSYVDVHECWLRVETGINIRGLMLTQKAMLKSMRTYDSSREVLGQSTCFASFAYDILPCRLRDATPVLPAAMLMS